MKNIVVYFGMVMILVATGLYLWESKTIAESSVMLKSDQVSSISVHVTAEQ